MGAPKAEWAAREWRATLPGGNTADVRFYSSVGYSWYVRQGNLPGILASGDAKSLEEAQAAAEAADAAIPEKRRRELRDQLRGRGAALREELQQIEQQFNAINTGGQP